MAHRPRLFIITSGLQKYIRLRWCFFAPYVNSYRRLVRHTAAPINVHWGQDNRTVGIRVPDAGPQNRRVENRVIGTDANPYVALAATLACGYLGLIQQLKPAPEMTNSAYDEDYQLPESLNEAVRLLDECPDLEQVFGKRFCGIYKAVKLTEFAES